MKQLTPSKPADHIGLSSHDSGGVLQKGSRWHVLLASWLGQMFDGMDATIFVLVLFPTVSELVGSSSHSVVGIIGSYVLATFMIGWAVGAIGFGILTDYIGRTKTMIITVLLYAVCTGLCALSHNWIELAIYRFFVGCGVGGEIIVGAVLMSEFWQGKARLHATSFMTSSFGCGYLCAALLNLLLGHLGWRWLFVAGLVPAVLTLYIRTFLEEPIEYQFTKEQRKRLVGKDRNSLTAEERALLQFTLPQIFNSENRYKVLVITALATTAIIGYWAVLAWIPPWINQLTGTAAITERSLTAVFMNVGGIISACMAGTIIGWVGRKYALRLSFIVALGSCLGMFLTVKSFSPILLLWAFVVGFSAIMPFTVIFIYVPELFANRLKGTAFGFSVQIGRVFAAMAALLGGQLIAAFGGSYAAAAACLSLIYIFGTLATWFMPPSPEEANSLEGPRFLADALNDK